MIDSPESTSRTTLGCLIVDDEPLAREHLRRLIDDEKRLSVAGEAASGPEALEMLTHTGADIVFLDIRMPGLPGTDVARRLPERVHLVFTTAFEEYAVTAFELQAIDYLLKPFSRKRFRQCVERLLGIKSVRTADRVEAALADEPELNFITVRTRGRLHMIAVDEIPWMEAADDYVAVHHADDVHLVSVTMKELESRLPSGQFVRVHRSHIVRLRDVERVDLTGSGRAAIELTSGEMVPVSRSGLGRLRAVLRGREEPHRPNR